MLFGHSISDATGRIIAIDPTVCEIMQRSECDLVGMSYVDLTHPEDRTRNVDLVDRLTVLDGPMAIRKRYVRPDGSSVWTDVQVSRLNAGVDKGRLIGTIQLVDPNAVLRDPESLWQSARSANASIQQRREELGDDLFSDHAWIILLQVYLAEAEGRIIDGPSIAEATRLQAVGVERWLRVLQERKLVELTGRSGFIAQLTTSGSNKVEQLLERNGL